MEREYSIYLWRGCGYILDEFKALGTCEEDAIDNLVTKLVNENIGKNVYWSTIEELESQYSEEYIEELGYIYIDATMSGANFPIYLFAREMKIEQN